LFWNHNNLLEHMNYELCDKNESSFSGTAK
jgi:hypothetical protein